MHDEDWDNLEHHLDDDEEEDQDTEHLILHSLGGIVAFEKREADKCRLVMVSPAINLKENYRHTETTVSRALE